MSDDDVTGDDDVVSDDDVAGDDDVVSDDDVAGDDDTTVGDEDSAAGDDDDSAAPAGEEAPCDGLDNNDNGIIDDIPGRLCAVEEMDVDGSPEVTTPDLQCQIFGYDGGDMAVGWWWFQCATPGPCPDGPLGPDLVCSSYLADCTGMPFEGPNSYPFAAQVWAPNGVEFGPTDTISRWVDPTGQSWSPITNNPGVHVGLKCYEEIPVLPSPSAPSDQARQFSDDGQSSSSEQNNAADCSIAANPAPVDALAVAAIIAMVMGTTRRRCRGTRGK